MTFNIKKSWLSPFFQPYSSCQHPSDCQPYRPIWASEWLFMVQTYPTLQICSTGVSFNAGLGCSSKNRKATLRNKTLWPQIPSKEQSVVVEITCFTASEVTHLPWLPFWLEKGVPKFQVSRSSKDTSSTPPPPSSSFLSDVSKSSWQMISNSPTLQCLGHVEEQFLKSMPWSAETRDSSVLSLCEL